MSQIQKDFILGQLTLAGFPLLDSMSMSYGEFTGWIAVHTVFQHAAAQHSRNMRIAALMYRSDAAEGFRHRVRWEDANDPIVDIRDESYVCGDPTCKYCS